MHVFVTGANGFVGSFLLERLSLIKDIKISVAVRHGYLNNKIGVHQYIVGDINGSTDWKEILKGCDIVIHLAGRAHVTNETHEEPLKIYREINVEGTLNLVRAAATQGVKRFIFISSIKVNGEGYNNRTNFSTQIAYKEKDDPEPGDVYGKSKHEAENGLKKLALETGIEFVIIRPPLVFGPGVKANMLSLIKIVKIGVPLPFASINNCRSFIYVENLVDFITVCMNSEKSKNQTFVIGDGTNLSTPDLIRYIGRAMGKPTLLFGIPESILWAIARLIRKERSAQRLFGSLVLDDTKAKLMLNWAPPITLPVAMLRTVKPYLKSVKQ